MLTLVQFLAHARVCSRHSLYTDVCSHSIAHSYSDHSSPHYAAYSIADLQHVTDYGLARGVRVMPEFDMPVR